MTALHETAYPRLKSQPTPEDLVTVYTPNQEELELVRSQTRQPTARLGFMVLLKTFQRLGYFVPIAEVPEAILNHLMTCLELKSQAAPLENYDTSGTRQRHLKSIRDFLGITPVSDTTLEFLKSALREAATTKDEIPDIINVGLESMAKARYELPAFGTFVREAKAARAQVNRELFEAVYHDLSESAKTRIQEVLTPPTKTSQSKSLWDLIKQEPRKPTVSNVKEFVDHLRWLRTFDDCLPKDLMLPAPKLKRFVIEARALNVANMNELAEHKRYALAALFIRAQTGKASDDIADIFIRIVQNLINHANEALKQHQLSQTQQVDALIAALRDVIQAYQIPGTEIERLDAIAQAFQGEPDELKKRCDEQLAYANNNYLPFMLSLYRSKRALLFDCVAHMDLQSTTQDQSTLDALALIMGHRRSRKPTLDAVNAKGEPLDLSWIPDKWLKLVTGKTTRNRNNTEVHRKYFELCLLTTLAQELKSGDVVIMGSDKYGDFRDQLVSWEEYHEQIAEYGELAGIITDPKALIAELKRWLRKSSNETDKKFPGNDQVRIEKGELVIQRVKRKPIPAALERINRALDDRLSETSILDVLIDMEKWLGLSKGFKPLSGHETKLTDHQRRFIVTLFCFGCNLGPTQTSRSIEGINRRQIAWLNLRHSTEEKIDEAITKVINAYNRFSLPKIWGTGKTASADGTKWDLYEQNLLSEHHLRYLGTGGLGYYHLSDTYIALFSHFIPCGVYEAVYILDGLLKNQSDIQPDTIHGDTQSQSEAVFGLAYLLGIKLMPRIRGIKHLKLYRISKEDHFKHIDTLFKDTIKWELIESCLPDMLRIALSVKAGRINASTILRRLGTYSRKNKLYLALRELGRVVWTVFLLQYIAEAEIREMIQAATCKSEEFNDFLQWVMFGNDGLIAENVRHEQQKIIKYNHLVANMIILYNVVTMTKALGELAEEGYPIDPEVLAGTSPFRRGNINRFGTYSMNMDREVPNIEFNIPIPIPDKDTGLIIN